VQREMSIGKELVEVRAKLAEMIKNWEMIDCRHTPERSMTEAGRWWMTSV
jgi:hypothetical protein